MAVAYLLMERQSQGTILEVSTIPLVVRSALLWFKNYQYMLVSSYTFYQLLCVRIKHSFLMRIN